MTLGPHWDAVAEECPRGAGPRSHAEGWFVHITLPLGSGCVTREACRDGGLMKRAELSPAYLDAVLVDALAEHARRGHFGI